MSQLPGVTALLERVTPHSRLWRSAAQICLFGISGAAAFLLRFESNVPAVYLSHLAAGVLVWSVVKTIVFRLYSLDHGWWRFFSVDDAVRLLNANLLGSLASMLVIVFCGPARFPRSIYVIDFLLSVTMTAGVRMAARLAVETAGRMRNGSGRRTLIYGAGSAGAMLARELRANPDLGYRVRGFVDDEATKQGLYVQGVPVLGRGADISRLSARENAEEILIALPSAGGEQMTRILRHCHGAGVRFHTISGPGGIIGNKGLSSQIREVRVEDLLSRAPVRLDQDRIRHKLEGGVVMVTGGAGSIGSELCRQAARFRPAAILAYDVAETPLFHLGLEMAQLFPDVCFRPEVGSIQNRLRLAEVLERYQPSVIYHAAAYKHVPMMESSLFEAIENNVFGTFNVAMAAEEHGVEDFVLISSDKAVRPVSVMGATKRLTELLVLSLQNHGPEFAAVRFGNVLGSNGSVIPLFKEQIAAGGPVTVTHPEMRRYFMTVSEAVQLVLQASTMGKGGEIFVLDMGQPVRIVDLARNLILLSGLRPDVDIKIEFTGPRPGEKLYEELNLAGEETRPTYHEKIRIFTGNGLSAAEMLTHLERLRRLCAARDAVSVILLLKELVPDYNPSAHVLRTLLAPERGGAGAGASLPVRRLAAAG
jgi:FlaA1/EpsC-like NDP-sugar epimerase